MAPPPTPPTPPPSPEDSTPHSGGRGEQHPPRKRTENPGTPSGTPHPALRRTVIRPGGAVPDPVDGAFVANRLTTLVHELSTLLDGSMRVIGLARRSLVTHDLNADRTEKCSVAHEPCPERLERQLETVDAAIRQMADLVRSTMIGMAEGGIAGVREGYGASSSLSDAVRHAAEVMTPLAEECCVQMETQIGPDLGGIAAGPIYAVITNGVRNAIESIQRVGDRYVGGRVLVRAWTEDGRTGRCVMITIEDDGEGLVDPRGRAMRPSAPSRADGSVFRLGFSTKPRGSGIGLALCRDVVEQLGGTIELLSRPLDPASGRGGAVLSICYPMPRAMTSV